MNSFSCRPIYSMWPIIYLGHDAARAKLEIITILELAPIRSRGSDPYHLTKRAFFFWTQKESHMTVNKYNYGYPVTLLIPFHHLLCKHILPILSYPLCVDKASSQDNEFEVMTEDKTYLPCHITVWWRAWIVMYVTVWKPMPYKNPMHNDKFRYKRIFVKTYFK